MKIKDIALKSDKELKALLAEKRNDFLKLKLDIKQNKLKNTRSVFNTRKDIARILTLVKERELVAPKTKEGLEK